MRYLELKQIDTIAPDFSDTIEFLSEISETIDNFNEEVMEKIDKVIDLVKNTKILLKLEKLQKQIEKENISIKTEIDGKINKILDREQNIINEIEHVAVCNEIYNNLEVNRLLKELS